MRNLILKLLQEHISEQRKFWTYDEVKDIAKKYSTLKDFRENESRAFLWAKKNKFLPEITSHMVRQKVSKSKDDISNLAVNYTKLGDFIKDYPNEYRQATQKGWSDLFSGLTPTRESWTLEKVLDLAKNTKSMEDFRKTYPNAYDVSRRHEGWKEELWKLFKPQQVSWTYELAKSIADKYDDLTDFQKNESKTLAAIRRLGWLDLLSHMNKDKRTWTDDEIRQEALKFDNVKDFREKSRQAYYAATSHKIYDEVTAHMERAYTLEWTKDMVWKEALKYNTRSEFMKGNYAAYQQAHNKGWIEDVTSHMTRLGNLYNRIVYVYEFPDNSAYVGLTLNKKDRDQRHKQKVKSAVYKHIQATGLQPVLKYVTDDYINAEDARNMEKCTIEKYRQDGWNILNKADAGGLGGCSKNWKKGEVIVMALKYNQPSEFRRKHSSAFNAAKRNGWLDDIFKHMTNKKRRYSDDDISLEMGQYPSSTELRKQNENLWSAAYRRFGSKFITDFYKNK